MAAAEQAFHDAHARAYGFSAPGEPTQIVNLRLAAVGRIPRLGAAPRPVVRPEARTEADPPGLLRGGRRLRRDADLRPGGARARDLGERPGDRRRDGFHDRHPPGLPGRRRRVGQPRASAEQREGVLDEARRARHPARDEHVLVHPHRRRGVRARHDRRHARRPARAGGLGRLRRDRDHDRRLPGRRLAARRRRRPDRLRHDRARSAPGRARRSTGSRAPRSPGSKPRVRSTAS